MRPARAANVLAAAVLCLVVVRSYGPLPDPVPSHFGAGSQPDAWMAKAPFFAMIMGSWGALQLLALGLVPWMVRKVPPRMINIPNRQWWLATPERWIEARRRLVDLMDWTGAFLSVVFLWVMNLVLRASGLRPVVDIPPEWDLPLFLVLVAGFVAFTIWSAFTRFRVRERG